MTRDALFRWIVGSALLSFSFSLQASSFIIGEPPLLATGNCDPFGCPEFFGLGTYQQVYTSSAFPSESTITGITFYNDQVSDGASPAGGTYQLSFSYSNNGPGDLNTTDPNDNVSSASQVFFVGTLPFLSEKTLDFVGSPFVYDPANGNLLLTVTVDSPVDHLPTLFLDEAARVNQTTDAFFGTNNGGNFTGGLVTGFTVVSSLATPEPASVLLMLGGVSLLLCRRRRHGRI